MFSIIKVTLLLFSLVLRLFPYRFLIFLGDIFGLIFYYIIRFRRLIVEENIKKAFSSKLEPSKIRELARKNYCNYGRTLMDFLISISWTKKDYLSKVELIGVENLPKGEGGFYFLSCHLASWELAIGVTASLGIPLNVIVKRAKSDLVESFFKWYREKTGARILYESHSHYEIMKAISNGRAVGFIMDQFMGPPIGLPVNFFGHVAGTAAAFALFLERKNAPVIPVYCVRKADGKLATIYEKELDFGELSLDRDTRLYQRTQTINNSLEKIISSYPEQWLWLHRRWKPFIGKPRWQKACFTALFFFLLGCASTGGSKTGIEIPHDPASIEVPKEFIESKEVVPPKLESVTKTNVIKPKKKKKITSTKPLFTKIPPQKIPFKVGEKMVIELTWLALPAGRAVLEVREGEVYKGRKTWHFWGNVLSSKIVDKIYHVDNTIESFVDFEGLIPYKFLLHMFETRQLKETKVVFDHLNGKAHYWSKRISKHWGDEKKDVIDDIKPLSQDIYSALYYTRTLDFELNKTISFFIYENSKNMEVKATPVSNELVNTKVGFFQAWKIDVELFLDNVLKQTGKSFLWLSDDSNKFIVKFEAEVKIGSLKGTLVELKEGE